MWARDVNVCVYNPRSDVKHAVGLLLHGIESAGLVNDNAIHASQKHMGLGNCTFWDAENVLVNADEIGTLANLNASCV